jgi:hypothetical protein
MLKKIEKGNNLFGRNGREVCAECRRRGRKVPRLDGDLADDRSVSTIIPGIHATIARSAESEPHASNSCHPRGSRKSSHHVRPQHRSMQLSNRKKFCCWSISTPITAVAKLVFTRYSSDFATFLGEIPFSVVPFPIGLSDMYYLPLPTIY